MRAILLVHYGASRPKARAVLDGLARETAEACPGWTVSAAWTGEALLRRARAAGEAVSDVAGALAALAEAGAGEVAVQPTLLHRGAEYAALCAALAPFRTVFPKMAAGRPLLETEEDCAALCRILARHFPCGAGEVLLLAGHAAGNSDLYSRLNAAGSRMGPPRIAAAALTDFGWALDRLREMGAGRVILVPLLLTPGVHALRDIAGEEPASWRSRLAAEGYAVRTAAGGLAELPEFRARIAALARETAAVCEQRLPRGAGETFTQENRV